MNVNRDIVPIWWVWLHDLDIPWHQRNHFKVRLFVTNHESCLKCSPFLIQFSQILLAHLFIDTNLISLWLSGLLTLGNLLNTWLSAVSTLSSSQTRHGHEWCLVTILLHSPPGPLESVALLNTPLAPLDTIRDIRDITAWQCHVWRDTETGDWLICGVSVNCVCITKINLKARLSWSHSFSHLCWYFLYDPQW